MSPGFQPIFFGDCHPHMLHGPQGPHGAGIFLPTFALKKNHPNVRKNIPYMEYMGSTNQWPLHRFFFGGTYYKDYYKAYGSGNIPTKHGLIWYSSSILGSWNRWTNFGLGDLSIKVMVSSWNTPTVYRKRISSVEVPKKFKQRTWGCNSEGT